MCEEKIQTNQVCTWLEFETALKQMFCPVDYLDNVRSRLRSLRHGQNMSYDEYVSKFLTYTTELKMNDADRRQLFVDGLRESTKLKLRTTPGIDTFQKARELATQYERSIQSSGSAQVNYAVN
jgi:hypothetical protein